MKQLLPTLLAAVLAGCGGSGVPPSTASNQTVPLATEARRPADDAQLRFWLENMAVYHRFNDAEISAATGLSSREVSAAMKRLRIDRNAVPKRNPENPMLVLPYPGGRHPRIGFLDGAIDPQRETKVSVFAPWSDGGYAVVDVPEAIFCNLGLIYLAHTHIPTVWDQQKIKLERAEWQVLKDGKLTMQRKLPNNILFGTTITPKRDIVEMEMWVTNNTDSILTEMRAQVCVMLKGLQGFNQQTNENVVMQAPYVARRSEDGRRWIITAWEPLDRPWMNPPVPCIHSDPRFKDCGRGRTQRVRGIVSFYEGQDIAGELKRLEASGWRL